MVNLFTFFLRPFINALKAITPLVDLLARIWVGQIFFLSGLVKIQSWETTVMLFTHVYHVPFLSPTVAAVMGTAAELILPVLLVLGLGGRVVIFIFFIYNGIAAISYPFLWTAQGAAGLDQHVDWSLLLMLLMCYGPGTWSIDHLIHYYHGHHLIKVKK